MVGRLKGRWVLGSPVLLKGKALLMGGGSFLLKGKALFRVGPVSFSKERPFRGWAQLLTQSMVSRRDWL